MRTVNTWEDQDTGITVTISERKDWFTDYLWSLSNGRWGICGTRLDAEAAAREAVERVKALKSHG